MEEEYEVTWGMVYLASSPEDAVSQALGDLAQVLAHPAEGPNIFVTRRTVDPMSDTNVVVVSADEAIDKRLED